TAIWNTPPRGFSVTAGIRARHHFAAIRPCPLSSRRCRDTIIRSLAGSLPGFTCGFHTTMPRRKYPWTTLTDDELLEVRLKDLKVTIEGTWLEKCLRALNRELDEHDIRVRPHAWISSEWFSPEGTPGIAIPFYLAHPRLMQLEKKMILEVEGGAW